MDQISKKHLLRTIILLSVVLVINIFANYFTFGYIGDLNGYSGGTINYPMPIQIGFYINIVSLILMTVSIISTFICINPY